METRKVIVMDFNKDEIANALAECRTIPEIIEKLNCMGFSISEEEIMKNVSEGELNEYSLDNVAAGSAWVKSVIRFFSSGGGGSGSFGAGGSAGGRF